MVAILVDSQRFRHGVSHVKLPSLDSAPPALVLGNLAFHGFHPYLPAVVEEIHVYAEESDPLDYTLPRAVHTRSVVFCDDDDCMPRHRSVCCSHELVVRGPRSNSRLADSCEVCAFVREGERERARGDLLGKEVTERA
jgi:hypothetical protein